MNKFSNHSLSRYAVVSLIALLSTAFSMPLQAAEMWKVNLAKSSFNAHSNTVVLERVNKAANQSIDAKADAGAGTFLVVSDGKIYLAADPSADFSNGLTTVDYTRWRDMKLVQIGDNVRSVDHCGFRCQFGIADNRLTLTFASRGLDASKYMEKVIVLNNR